jgi:hypothetical protein
MADEANGNGGVASLGLIFSAVLMIVVGIWVFGGFAGASKPTEKFNIRPPITEPSSPPTTP